MKLKDLFATANSPLVSCEFFPPKTDKGEANLWQCLQELKIIHPAFVSVTYGAGGSTQERTRNIVTRIKNETDLTPVAHLTCVGATATDIAGLLADYHQAGIENILALRGDPPQGMDRFQATRGGFSHATDLIAFIRRQNDFCIGCATYPEGHPESPGGAVDDIRYLKMKQDLGADYAITQYFFDNEVFFRFLDAAEHAGITLPIIPGIMPINNFEQIVRFSAMCGASIPSWLEDKMLPLRNDPEAMQRMGIDIATRQCEALLHHGVPGLHFYTLNKSRATIAICERIGLNHEAGS